MPQNRFEKYFFGITMALSMIYGMEIYNQILRGIPFPKLLFIPLAELFGLLAFVIIFQELFGARIARPLAFYLIRKNAIFKRAPGITISVCTVSLMCPLMSLVATLWFKLSIPTPIFILWIQTVCVNFPMALFLQILIVGPWVRFLLRKVRRLSVQENLC